MGGANHLAQFISVLPLSGATNVFLGTVRDFWNLKCSAFHGRSSRCC